MRWSAAAIGGLVVGLVFGLGGALGGALVVGLVGALVFGLGASRIDPIDRVQWSWQKVRASWRSNLVFGLVFGLFVALVVRPVFGLVFGLVGGLLGALGWPRSPGRSCACRARWPRYDAGRAGGRCSRPAQVSSSRKWHSKFDGLTGVPVSVLQSLGS